MGRPQQPELARSAKTDLDPDRIGTELEARKPVPSGGRTGPVPPENEPGHHPDEEQDKPDLDAFAARLQGEDRPEADDRPEGADRPEGEGGPAPATSAEEVQTTPAKRPAGTPGWPESAPAPQDPGPLGSPEEGTEAARSGQPLPVGLALVALRGAVRGLERLERSITARWRR